MKSLFNPQHSQEFINRINKLNPDAKARWGKMKVEQMLAHCQVPLKLAQGEMKIKGNPIIRFLFGKSAKASLLKNVPFKQNLPTFPEAKVANAKSFETEKAALIREIEKFANGGLKGVTKDRHPFFWRFKRPGMGFTAKQTYRSSP